MAKPREMVSVGIDIGTTTTQIIFSQLTLVDVARPGQIPRIDITTRKVLYESEIVFTPLLDGETIDAARLADIIRREYSRAGITPQQTETGAAIITGETAKKKNADEVLSAVSGLAGDFVVTVAGPHVESVIAGRGSGAAEYSRQHFTSVCNIDIGGGSANSAIFKQGEAVAASAMNFGGRIIEIEPVSGQVRRIARPAQAILNHLGLRMSVGDRPTLADLIPVTRAMSGLCVELIEGSTSPLAQKIYLTPPSPISGRGRTLMVSGGVGYYFYDPISIHSLSDVTLYGDIGPLLAQSLREEPGLEEYRTVRPSETLRATVLGASSQTVTLSGSTIWAEQEVLPMKNLPVIRPVLEDMQPHAATIAAAVLDASRRWDLDLAQDRFAVALELDRVLDYPMLVEVAGGLYQFSQSLPETHPLVVIIKHDYAQVLGQTLKAWVGRRPLMIIDQVGLKEGDYIDIGMPLMDGRVVPLSVKTLIFYHE